MQVTPLEALDLLEDLAAKGLLTAVLSHAVAECIERYQLDRPVPGDGRREFVRRRYTCPLFKHEALGCPLSAAAKPYGCLGFNAKRAGVTAGEACGSDRAALEMREAGGDAEAMLNDALRQALGLEWEKTALPLALRQARDFARLLTVTLERTARPEGGLAPECTPWYMRTRDRLRTQLSFSR
jgi:hypothetical protein